MQHLFIFTGRKDQCGSLDAYSHFHYDQRQSVLPAANQSLHSQLGSWKRQPHPKTKLEKVVAAAAVDSPLPMHQPLQLVPGLIRVITTTHQIHLMQTPIVTSKRTSTNRQEQQVGQLRSTMIILIVRLLLAAGVADTNLGSSANDAHRPQVVQADLQVTEEIHLQDIDLLPVRH